jgi:hypothetical protein
MNRPRCQSKRVGRSFNVAYHQVIERDRDVGVIEGVDDQRGFPVGDRAITYFVEQLIVDIQANGIAAGLDAQVV